MDIWKGIRQEIVICHPLKKGWRHDIDANWITSITAPSALHRTTNSQKSQIKKARNVKTRMTVEISGNNDVCRKTADHTDSYCQINLQTVCTVRHTCAKKGVFKLFKTVVTCKIKHLQKCFRAADFPRLCRGRKNVVKMFYFTCNHGLT